MRIALLVVALTASAAFAGKQKVTRQDDLPRHTYTVTKSATEIVKSREEVMRLAQEIRANLESDLEIYDIEDKTTLQGIQQMLMTIDMLEGNWDSALERVATVRELEDKPAIRATSGMGIESRIAAIRASGSTDPEVMGDVFRAEYEKRVKALDWDLVADVLAAIDDQLIQMGSGGLTLGFLSTGTFMDVAPFEAMYAPMSTLTPVRIPLGP